MKDEKTLSHQYPGEQDLQARAAQAGAHFQAIAENIAMGPSAEAIEKQWMNSVPHRQNILDPQMNAIGIAVIEKNGYLYAVEDFANASESLTKEQVEQKVGDLLRQQKIDPSAPRNDRRRGVRDAGRNASGRLTGRPGEGGDAFSDSGSE